MKPIANLTTLLRLSSKYCAHCGKRLISPSQNYCEEATTLIYRAKKKLRNAKAHSIKKHTSINPKAYEVHTYQRKNTTVSTWRLKTT